ncbi:MAG: endonuclease V [Thermoplasmatota archaeon]
MAVDRVTTVKDLAQRPSTDPPYEAPERPEPLLARWSREQNILRELLEPDAPVRGTRVAAFDASYQDGIGYGALVVGDRETDVILESRTCAKPTSVPYVPGFLAFRELPLLRETWAGLSEKPGLLLIDGAGGLHPRRFGFASHAGVELDVATVGVTKSRFVGTPDRKTIADGESSPIHWQGGVEGYVWRPPRGALIYVSGGQRMSSRHALETVQRLTKARLPFPLPEADALSREARRMRAPARPEHGHDGPALLHGHA